jgi:hypothetical protein
MQEPLHVISQSGTLEAVFLGQETTNLAIPLIHINGTVTHLIQFKTNVMHGTRHLLSVQHGVGLEETAHLGTQEKTVELGMQLTSSVLQLDSRHQTVSPFLPSVETVSQPLLSSLVETVKTRLRLGMLGLVQCTQETLLHSVFQETSLQVTVFSGIPKTVPHGTLTLVTV